MRHENGEWMLHGTEASDPSRIRDPEGLIAYVEQAGFLPLFQNEIPGFSVEEHTLAEAVLLGSDEVAEGALEAFRELGIRVPKDVAVIIYQDIQTLESKWPTGTCLEMFPDYVWENALELLFPGDCMS